MILGAANSLNLNMSLTNFLHFATQLKVEFVEIKMDDPYLLLALSETKHRKEVKDIIKSFNFKYCVHAPHINTNLAGINPTLREASEKTIFKSILFAAEIDAKLVVSHVGRLSKDYPEKIIAQSLENTVTCLGNLRKTSENNGIIFTIENDHNSNDQILAGYPEQLMLLIQKTDCKFTLDVGHANTLTKIENFFNVLAEHIVNIHFHDNNGKQDTHVSLGEGNISFPAILKDLRKIKYNGPLMLEVHSPLGIKKSVTLLQKIFNTFN